MNQEANRIEKELKEGFPGGSVVTDRAGNLFDFPSVHLFGVLEGFVQSEIIHIFLCYVGQR